MEIRVGEEANAAQCHPLVRTHPVTGRKALFVNDVYTIGLAGMTEAESVPILGYLFARIRTRSPSPAGSAGSGAPLRCRITAVPSTTLSTTTATGGRRREMYRTTLAGERPV
jgi:taurine dioxygenase